MKITSVEPVWTSVPVSHAGPPTGFGGRPWTHLNILFVRVETDSGLVGWGEAFGHNALASTKAAVETMIAPLAVGRDATRIAELTLHLQRTLHNFGRYGQTLFAISGLDIALWDLAGKAAGLPLHRLIGGLRRDVVPAYASLMRYTDPDVVGRQTAAMVQRGYDHVKLHEITTEAVGAAREAGAPDTELMVDTNCPWTVQQAIDMAHAMAPYDIHWLEEPVWPPEDGKGLAEVRLTGGVPIAAGENASTAWEFRSLFEAEAIDIAQPSVTKVGGITEYLKVATLAEAHGVRMMPHSPYFGPGLLATVQLLGAAPEGLLEVLSVDLEASPYGDALVPVDGMVRVPDGPGLGIDPDPAFIDRYRTG